MDIILNIAEKFGGTLDLSRMIESLLVFAVVWSRLSPHLKKIEARLQGMEDAVKIGFESGNKRFESIESRLTIVEKRENES